MKRKHNIELPSTLNNNVITIKGNNLTLRWFGDCLLVWSDDDNKEPNEKKILEAVEDKLKSYDKLNYGGQNGN